LIDAVRGVLQVAHGQELVRQQRAHELRRQTRAQVRRR
jgi:hypothetical protein